MALNARACSIKETMENASEEAERSMSFCFDVMSQWIFLTVAFAEIDWHEYATVQTIEFTAAYANAEAEVAGRTTYRSVRCIVVLFRALLILFSGSKEHKSKHDDLHDLCAADSDRELQCRNMGTLNYWILNGKRATGRLGGTESTGLRIAVSGKRCHLPQELGLDTR